MHESQVKESEIRKLHKPGQQKSTSLSCSPPPPPSTLFQVSMHILNRAEKERKEIKKIRTQHKDWNYMHKLYTQADAAWISVIAVTDSSLFLILVLPVLPKIVNSKSNSCLFVFFFN